MEITKNYNVRHRIYFDDVEMWDEGMWLIFGCDRFNSFLNLKWFQNYPPSTTQWFQYFIRYDGMYEVVYEPLYAWSDEHSFINVNYVSRNLIAQMTARAITLSLPRFLLSPSPYIVMSNIPNSMVWRLLEEMQEMLQ